MESAETVTISHSVSSGDASYNGLAVNNVAVTVTSEDVAGVVLSKTSASVTEDGATDSYTVVLESEPTADVTVSLAFNATDIQARVGAGAFQGSPLVLTFTAANWNTAQTVEIQAVDDSELETAENVVITHTVSSGDTNYNGIAPKPDDEVTVSITDNENIPPVLTEIGDQTVNEGEMLTFDANAADSDIPVQTLTFSLTDAPTGATIDSATGVFSWTPGENDGGQTFDITVTVTDSGSPAESDSETVAITVNEVNIAPVLAEIGNRSGYLGETLTFAANATDADLPAQNLTFSLDPAAPIGSFIDPVTGVFSWMLNGSVVPGDYTVTITLTDDGSPALNDSETITLSIGEVNTLDNYGFETVGASEKFAQGWTPLETRKKDRRVCNSEEKSVAREGQCAYQFTSPNVTTALRIVQRTVDPTSFAKGDTLQIRGWVKANNLTAGGRLMLIVKYANGKKAKVKANLSTGTYEYQQISAQITLARPVVKVVARIQAGRTTGTFFVDDLAVVKLPAAALNDDPDVFSLPSAPDMGGTK